MNNVYVIDALRTPIGKHGGALAGVRPDDLAALVIKAILNRNQQIDPKLIEDVILGAANQAGEDNRNVARMASLLAGMPISVPGVTVNRLCASGLQAIMDAAKSIAAGVGDCYLAGGVESMTRAPFVLAKQEQAFGRQVEMFDTTIGWRFTNAKLAQLYHPYSMGETAENVAKQFNISREEQDFMAYQSQLKYQQAAQENAFLQEMVPVEIPQKKGDSKWISTDEHPRLSSLEQLAALKPAFVKNGTVTAGNSSGINDGAACLMLANDHFVRNSQSNPLARVVSMAVAGVDPAIMGIGPVPAVQKALQRAQLKVSDIGLWEVNEAFAAQAVACIKALQIDPNLVNVHGGSIALGHPLGASGARIATTLIYAMKKRNCRWGVATMCVGVGQGAAIVFENI